MVALTGAGCGYVGDPLPPLANVPGHIADLAVVQRGGRLLAHFTVPPNTTEGLPIQTPLRLDLRIGTAVPDFTPAAWAESARPVQPVSVKNGLAEYDIPASTWAGKEVTIAARAIGANGKDSGWSPFINLLVTPPPAAPADVKTAATPDGVKVTWQGPAGEYHVLRRAGDEKSFSPVASVSANEWLDRAAEFGKPYTYVVQRTVPAGNRVAESELSDPASITPKDTFPPAPPTGLRALGGTNSVELTWERNPEPDLAGYRVYRASGDDPFARLADVSQLPAYSDHNVEAGKTYRYRITALDQAGNESGPSALAAAGT